MTGPVGDDYALKSGAIAEILAPDLPYLPPSPRHYRPRIGIIGAGGIAAAHLDAYRTAGWEVAAICDRTIGKAQARAHEFAPKALVFVCYLDVLADPTIDVIDITTHPADRIPIIEAALREGKHVLSQKPFVFDLKEGERLAQLARDNGVKLAVNQNGRWAPHLAWMREAVRAGLIGDVQSVHISLHWKHGWIAGTVFDSIEDVILFDFGVHWFDFLSSIVGKRAQSVVAMAAKGMGQTANMPLMAQALVRLDGGQASLIFDGIAAQAPRDTTYICGTMGSLRSDGPDLGVQTVTLTTAKGWASPRIQGTWFNDGFKGAMGALLVAIEEDAEPANGVADNLQSLALAFAAVQSRRSGREVLIGDITQIGSE